MGLLWAIPISLDWFGMVLILTGWLGMKLSYRWAQESIREIAFSTSLGVRGHGGWMWGGGCIFSSADMSAMVARFECFWLPKEKGAPCRKEDCPAVVATKKSTFLFQGLSVLTGRVESKIVIFLKNRWYFFLLNTHYLSKRFSLLWNKLKFQIQNERLRHSGLFCVRQLWEGELARKSHGLGFWDSEHVLAEPEEQNMV